MISRKQLNADEDCSPLPSSMPKRPTDRSTTDPLWLYCLLVLAAGLYLFFISDRSINLYDQGIALTNVMRVGAGQVVHRDFYYNYGPAGLYLGAATFKVFGRSVLALSIEGIAQQALTALFFYICALRLSNRRLVALAAFIASVLWSETLGVMTLFTLWPTWLLMEVFERDAPARRVYTAGFMAGFTTLLRYDIGFGLAATHAVVIFLAGVMRHANVRRGVGRSIPVFAIYLAGWATLVVPLFVVYYAAGALPDFLYDIVRYPAKYYHLSRNLPFPRIHPRLNFEEVVVYIFPILIAIAFYQVVRWWLRTRRSSSGAVPQWTAALVSFGAVAVVMYIKGLVRISAGSLFMCAGTCILLSVVLYTQYASMDRVVRGLTTLLLIVIAIGGVTTTLHEIERVRGKGALMLSWFLSPDTQAPSGSFRSWCKEDNPLTKGVCYFPDDDHISAIRYLVANTRPGDTLYVGLPSHDRILINDNLIYFATQRLPATKWSHFDPFLQTRADIQQEMIRELETNRPPYVVLDSEFDQDAEPNGSAVHTGVHLLDQYIASQYMPVQRFGELTILRRR